MPSDHYVARTYLKHFVGPDGMLHAYRKSDGKYFPCRPADICNELDGDVIERFLADPDYLGKWRAAFEPAWNPALKDLEAGKLTRATKFLLAGYWANLLVCTPARRRIDLKSFEFFVPEEFRSRAELLAETGDVPENLKMVVDALDSGSYQVTAYPDGIRAMQVTSIEQISWDLYNAIWIVYKNPTGIDLVTSDNPVSFEDPGEKMEVLPRFLTVNTKLCLCFIATRAPEEDEPDLNKPPRGVVRTAIMTPDAVHRVNKAIIQCAEELVLFATKSTDIAALVAKNARYRVDIDFFKERREGSFILGMRERVREQV